MRPNGSGCAGTNRLPRTLTGDAEAVVDVPMVGGEVVITFGGDIDKLGEALSDSVFPQPENANPATRPAPTVTTVRTSTAILTSQLAPP